MMRVEESNSFSRESGGKNSVVFDCLGLLDVTVMYDLFLATWDANCEFTSGLKTFGNLSTGSWQTLDSR